MDMASQKVYFWHSTSNAVEWDPPPGGMPRQSSDSTDLGATAPDSDLTAPGSSTQHTASSAKTAAPRQGGGDSVAPAVVPDTAAANSPSAAMASAQRHPAAQPQGGSAKPQAQLPSEELARRTAALVERLRAASGGLFAAAPKLVWLAIEAEIRAKVTHCFVPCILPGWLSPAWLGSLHSCVQMLAHHAAEMSLCPSCIGSPHEWGRIE